MLWGTVNQVKDNEGWLGQRLVILYRLVRGGLLDKVTFEQRPDKVRDGVMQLLGQLIQAGGRICAKLAARLMFQKMPRRPDWLVRSEQEEESKR